MSMNVVFAGCTSLYGQCFSAVNTKTRLMALGLIESGAKCAIYDGLLGYSSEQHFFDNGIEVVLPKRKGSVFFGELMNISHFHRFLKKRSLFSDHNILVVELPLYHNYLAYVCCARLLGYKIVVIAHEWAPTLVHSNLYAKLSSFLYTKTFGYLVDGSFPISEYIIQKMRHFGKPFLKVPAIADFSHVNHNVSSEKTSYFLYCANVNYARVLHLIIDAFSEYKSQGGSYNLKLVLSGSHSAINAIKNRLSDYELLDYVSIYSKLPYNQLFDFYCNASALLIPLDPDYEQDTARFPQKIAEYCSVSVPIVTTNVGEVKYYFNESSCLKASFSGSSFSEKMKWIENHPTEASQMGINSYRLGLEEFEYKNCGRKIYDFLNNIIKCKESYK